MSALDRAKTYARIFVGAGADWWQYIPVDAKRHGDVVYLDGVRMSRSGDNWLLETEGARLVVRPQTGPDRP